jgi:hypothetical protein
LALKIIVMDIAGLYTKHIDNLEIKTKYMSEEMDEENFQGNI